jgi:hypothetical protein
MYELLKYDKGYEKPVAASRVSSKEKASVERRNSHFDSMYRTVYHPPPFVSVSMRRALTNIIDESLRSKCKAISNQAGR